MIEPTDLRTTRAFYDRISRAYDLIAEASEHTARERGLELLAAGPGERVLEVGFGTGHALLALAEAVGEEGRVVGIDLSEGMAQVARERLTKADLGASFPVLALGDARRLPCADGTFDAAFSSFTLELFDDEDLPAVLAELRRVLRPGGRLAAVALEHEESRHLMVELYKWFHRHFPHFADCRPIPLIDHLAAAGFRVRRRVGLSVWSLPVAAVTAETAVAEA